MLHRIPRHLPHFADLRADLGNPHPAHLAAALGVDESTVRRWVKTGQCPRPAALALFWLTRWGASELDAELFNRWRISAALCNALQAEIRRMSDTDGRELLRRIQHSAAQASRPDTTKTRHRAGLFLVR